MARLRLRKQEKSYKGIIITVFIGFLMIASTIGFLVGFNSGGGPLDRQASNEITYNGFSFIFGQNAVATTVNGRQEQFYTLPAQVEYLNFSPDIVPLLRQAEAVVLTYNSSSLEAGAYSQTLFRTKQVLEIDYGKQASLAFTERGQVGSIPVMDCRDASERIPVILLGSESNITSILLEGNCIKVVSDNVPDFFRISDRFIYGLLGIIP